MTTGPMSQVGWASACSRVTSASSSRRRPRNGPPDAVSTSRATSSRASAAQALGERGVLGVDGHDLPGPRRRRDQRTARDQRLLVRQRERGARGERGQRRAQAARAGDPVEHGVGRRRGGELGGRVRTGEHVDARAGPGAARRPRPGPATATRRTPCARACCASRATSRPPAASPTTREPLRSGGDRRRAPACRSSRWSRGRRRRGTRRSAPVSIVGGHRRPSCPCCATMWPRGRCQVGASERWSVVARIPEDGRRAGVDPQDEPSAEWGWHGRFPRARAIAGVDHRDRPAGDDDRPVPDSPAGLLDVGVALG